MPFHWSKLYLFSAKLHEMDFGIDLHESLHRAVISRSYYSVLNVSCGYLSKKEGRTPSDNDRRSGFHTWIANQLEDVADENDDVQVKEVADLLFALRLYRESADYEDELRERTGHATTDAGTAIAPKPLAFRSLDFAKAAFRKLRKLGFDPLPGVKL